MKSILGFTAPAEPEQEPVISTPPCPDIPVKSLVKIRFQTIGKELTYYNDSFFLREGDMVFVSGKLYGQVGRVTAVSTKFRIHTKDYERVLSKLDISLHGKFHGVLSHMFCFGAQPVTPERFMSWVTPPADPKKQPTEDKEQDEIISGDGYTLNINDPGACEDVKEVIWTRGADYYLDGKVRYLSVQDGAGCAFVEGTEIYRVDFRLDDDGLMTGLYCDCPYEGLCKHEAAVALALRKICQAPGYADHKSFVALSKELFWRIVTLSEEITV